ncbi:hypothetical protein J7E24_04650 [Hymenobacter sp. ISL-91]|uniref:hypothetical protein n=1 Tax=Hymenobacter sp. ISL-91 TaxID=2819151 RepID=UPI001BEBCCF4|nr:hypothetical protein [Hymenobacter sp. ISL-91]MBT2557063.1 hypothetical protein [Hymenobacter sp. ISL-91]
MKKLLIFGLFLSFGAISCRTQCPAFTSVKPASHQATPVAPWLASAAAASGQP